MPHPNIKNNGIKMKKCPKCKIEKELSNFCKDKSKKTGLSSYCRQCSCESDEIYRNTHKLKVAKRHEKYRNEHREEMRERTKEYRRTHKAQRNEFRKQKRITDIEYKIKCNLRYRIWSAVKNNKKCESTEKLIGCSIKDLKNYLKARFVKNMTFDNYGKWHIDHIKPCDSFDLSKESEQKKCFHYSNLQPLWELENLKKSNKY